jgi:CP family cyanate transporter-like MFS transporter
MIAYGERLTLRRWPFLALGALSLCALTGLVTMDGRWLVAWSGVIGFCNAFLLILSLALPPLLARPDDVHRLSAAMFLVGYLCAFAIPIAGGFAWDATHAPRAAFAPLAAFGVLSLAVAARVDFARRRRD